MTVKPYTLYGMMASLYTAKVRAWFRYHGVAYVEHCAGDDAFTETVVPQTKRWIIPVVKTPDGTVLQDGTAILDWLDKTESHKGSIHTDQPVLQAVAHLFELFGGEGLLRPAMHYRWNFDADNLDFLKRSFRDVVPDAPDQEAYEALFLHASGRMRKVTKQFGVNEDNIEQVEASYDEFLALAEAHFSSHPFLLGGRPTIGDYGLFGPLFPHLGRDPKPLALMQQKAPALFQWIERMNAPAGYNNHLMKSSEGKLFADNALPETLRALMRYVADEYLGEITAHVEFANNWLADNPDIEPGTNGLKDPASRNLGFANFNWRGGTLSTGVNYYRFWLLQRLTDHVTALTDGQQESVRALFVETGLDPMLDLRTTRRVIRGGLLEVWE
jgi:glutathione S-transferase